MTSIILIIIGMIISILLSSFIIPRILVVAFRKRLFDVPDERKVHQGIVPRLVFHLLPLFFLHYRLRQDFVT